MHGVCLFVSRGCLGGVDRGRDRGAGVTGGGGDVLILLHFQKGSRRRVRRTRESKLYTSTYFFFLPNYEIHLTVFQSFFLLLFFASGFCRVI